MWNKEFLPRQAIFTDLCLVLVYSKSKCMCTFCHSQNSGRWVHYGRYHRRYVTNRNCFLQNTWLFRRANVQKSCCGVYLICFTLSECFQKRKYGHEIEIDQKSIKNFNIKILIIFHQHKCKTSNCCNNLENIKSSEMLHLTFNGILIN